MQGDGVRQLQHCAQVGVAKAKLCGGVLVRLGVERDDSHPEAIRDLDDPAADPADPNYPEASVPQIEPAQLRLAEFTASRTFDRLDEMAADR